MLACKDRFMEHLIGTNRGHDLLCRPHQEVSVLEQCGNLVNEDIIYSED